MPGRRTAGGAARSCKFRSIRTRISSREAERELRHFPPLVFAGEARRLKRLLAEVAAGTGLPVAGRRLRRKLRRVPSEQHPRHVSRAVADGGGADLRRGGAGGQGRASGRAVRQAPVVGYRDDRGPDPAGLSRRHDQRHGVHAGSARAAAGADAPRLQPVGLDAQSDPRLRAGRLRRSATRCTSGISASSPTARRGIATATWPAGWTRRSPSWRRAASPRRRRRKSARPASSPRTRRCCSTTRRRSPASTAPPATGTTRRRICCGSASGRGSRTERMSNSCAASATRWASSSGRGSPATS